MSQTGQTAQTGKVTKTIVFGELFDGPDSVPSGQHFIAIVSQNESSGRYLYSYLYPESWGYGRPDSLRDERVVGRILEKIAKTNSFEGEDRAQQSLDLLLAVGEEGVSLSMSVEGWRQLESSLKEPTLDPRYPEGNPAVPRIER